MSAMKRCWMRRALRAAITYLERGMWTEAQVAAIDARARALGESLAPFIE